MEILKTKTSTYSIDPANYNKKTPLWLKITADILLGLAGLIEVSSPEFPGKEYVVFGCIVFKFIAKTISDDLAESKKQ